MLIAQLAMATLKPRRSKRFRIVVDRNSVYLPCELLERKSRPPGRRVRARDCGADRVLRTNAPSARGPRRERSTAGHESGGIAACEFAREGGPLSTRA